MVLSDNELISGIYNRKKFLEFIPTGSKPKESGQEGM